MYFPNVLSTINPEKKIWWKIQILYSFIKQNPVTIYVPPQFNRFPVSEIIFFTFPYDPIMFKLWHAVTAILDLPSNKNQIFGKDLDPVSIPAKFVVKWFQIITILNIPL